MHVQRDSCLESFFVSTAATPVLDRYALWSDVVIHGDRSRRAGGRDQSWSALNSPRMRRADLPSSPSLASITYDYTSRLFVLPLSFRTTLRRSYRRR